jgi:hypothetical protein
MRIIKHAATGSQRRAVADRAGEGQRMSFGQEPDRQFNQAKK